MEKIKTLEIQYHKVQHSADDSARYGQNQEKKETPVPASKIFFRKKFRRKLKGCATQKLTQLKLSPQPQKNHIENSDKTDTNEETNVQSTNVFLTTR